MKTPLLRLAVGVLSLAFGLSACAAASGGGSSAPSKQTASQSTNQNGGVQEEGHGTVKHVKLSEAREAASVVASTRKLGLRVLEAFPKETLVTSPASAVIALSMLGTTATGEAEDQLSIVLGAPGEHRDAAVNALMGSLDPYRVPVKQIDINKLPDSPQVHLANQIVLDTGMKVESTYLDNLKTWYDAGVLETNLGTEEGFVPVNQWVKENTAGLIDKSAVSPSPTLRMILQNAAVFASSWQVPFSAHNTMISSFTTGSGERVVVEFMTATLPVRYAEVDGWQMAELPYGEDGGIVAHYVLPPEETPPTRITVDQMEALQKALTPAHMGISIPKLDLTSSADLTNPIQRAGLTSVFSDSPSALTYISRAEDLAVSIVMQQGRLRLDEEGTVAAALTEIAVEATAALNEPPIDFVADRPHLIFISETRMGWDLFQVLVNDPS